ncbi:hypothetical protein A3J15_02485 [Candidatus Roizmanbacteria bacterium RIFCSPLOWO2_02_FULL_38_10]|uniref:HTH arsR-type domain-containing protein n=1 Tax=Candidatus Roizmanbacteria bacterium RIFCSPLOWO2_02_FULL_38_10 TaxID=1802074 RepID=A0A1F7JNA7_9BACT|nr:MAG: hypothetical protein A3J15_02485 [Candidatus Roizmanbacteria bacterium RIFCSPLOWO2_02_FULL_38_10]
MLEYLIPSKTRRKILSLFFSDIDASYHLRRVGREVNEEINAVKRELDILTNGKILKKEKRLNKVIYTINDKYIFFNEFLRIIFKENYFTQQLLKNLSRLGKIKFICISEKFLKKQKIAKGEVYLLIVGIVVIPEIITIISSAEQKMGFEINYTVMTEEELAFRKKNNDPFLWGFLKQPKFMIIGEESELMK